MMHSLPLERHEKDIILYFTFVDNPPIGMRGTYPDKRQDIEERR
jgi:hypothetical protein